MKPNILTMEERHLVRDLILAEHMETMMQRSADEALTSGNLLRQLYAQISHAVMDRITYDKRRIRNELKRRQIRILDPEHSEFIIYHKVICRGYEENIGMTREVMLTEIRVRLTQYAGEVHARIMPAARK